MGDLLFCNCKKSIEEDETNLCFIDNCNNLLCPLKKDQTKDLNYNFSNQILIDNYKMKSAMNKIMKAYRKYRQNKNNDITNNKLRGRPTTTNEYTNNIKDIKSTKGEDYFKVEETCKNNAYNINETSIKIELNNDIIESTQNNNNNNNNNTIITIQNNNNTNNNDKAEIQIENTKEDNNLKNNNNNDFFHEMKNNLMGNPKTYLYSNKNDYKEDFGITIWNNEVKHIGYYRNNKAHGYGKLIEGKILYKGEFENDVANGYGIYINEDKTIYEGYWINNIQEKYGIEKYKDGSMYMGEYLNGKKNGIGTYIWADGDKYEGMWRDNNFDGYGIYYCSNDNAYYGEWKNKKKEGYGEYIWKDKKFLGFYSDDKKNGFGIIVWKDGHKAIVGSWKEGKQCGFGKFMNNIKTCFGIWNENNKIKWFKNENQAFEYLENKELTKQYKKFFKYNLMEIFDFCYKEENDVNIYSTISNVNDTV